MKRLLALIMTFLFALNNNVSYQASDYSVYAPDSYYKVEGNEPPDYRYIYENYTDLQASGKCIGTSVTIASSSKDLVHISDEASYLYWWSTLGSKNVDKAYLDGLGDSFTFEYRTNIIAPRDCKVLTKPSDGGGHCIDLITTDGKYSVHISDMERLFCDRKRTVPDDEDIMTHNWNHTVSIEGYVIRKGCLIGIATEGTTVTVKAEKEGLDSSMTGFYSQ